MPDDFAGLAGWRPIDHRFRAMAGTAEAGLYLHQKIAGFYIDRRLGGCVARHLFCKIGNFIQGVLTDFFARSSASESDIDEYSAPSTLGAAVLTLMGRWAGSTTTTLRKLEMISGV